MIEIKMRRKLLEFERQISRFNAEKRKEMDCRCIESEDEKHLHDITKRLCRVCYEYKPKHHFGHLMPWCSDCSSKIKGFRKQFGLSRMKARILLEHQYEYKKELRIEFLRKCIEENESQSPYSMVSGRVIDIRGNGVTADYNNGIFCEFSMEELEVLRRIREKRMNEEYNKIRIREKCLKELKISS